jgi:hypothetical protein
MKVGDMIENNGWHGIIIDMKKSTRPGLHCNPELRYECNIHWFRSHSGRMEGRTSWLGAWALKVL